MRKIKTILIVLSLCPLFLISCSENQLESMKQSNKKSELQKPQNNFDGIVSLNQIKHIKKAVNSLIIGNGQYKDIAKYYLYSQLIYQKANKNGDISKIKNIVNGGVAKEEIPLLTKAFGFSNTNNLVSIISLERQLYSQIESKYSISTLSNDERYVLLKESINNNIVVGEGYGIGVENENGPIALTPKQRCAASAIFDWGKNLLTVCGPVISVPFLGEACVLGSTGWFVFQIAQC